MTVKTQTELKKDILDLMIETIKDPETGKLPPEMEDSFHDFQTDADGALYLQTLVGIAMPVKDKTELAYSPNFAYNAEQTAIETSNLCKLACKAGWDFTVSPGHFITPEGQYLGGTMGYQANRAMQENLMIEAIKAKAKQMKEDQAPKLILPESKIITH